jgi:hypothetical protein
VPFQGGRFTDAFGGRGSDMAQRPEYRLDLIFDEASGVRPVDSALERMYCTAQSRSTLGT